VWDAIRDSAKPVVLYGTGDAAEKIIRELDIRNIRVSGIFASDGFVRDREFAGFKVTDYKTAKDVFGDMTVLLCFGSHRPDVMENIVRISREQDLYAPDLPVAGEGLFDKAFYEAHKDRLDAVRERLADDLSRLVFDKVIEYKLGGRIEPLLECSTPEEENWRLFLGGGSACGAGNGRPGGELPEGGKLFADLGAYTGDTVDLYRKIRNRKGDAIVALEPEPRNFRKLSENLKSLENTELINAAAWDSDGTAFFEKGKGRGTHEEAREAQTNTKPGTVNTVLRSLDSVLAGRRADYIKMDIEGAERRAILGAAQTIKSFRPRMLIAAYHRTEDLFDIPETVLSVRPDYRLFLRKDPAIPAWGVNYIFV
jgi:FkbM family methyltransferase